MQFSFIMPRPIFNVAGQQSTSAPDEKHLKIKMKTEVSAAASFVARLLRTTGLLSEHQLEQFSLALEEALGGK